jgi:hypothetical protein
MGYLAGDSIDYYRVWLGNEAPEFKTITLEDWALEDIPGEGYRDGKPNPGETINLDLRFINNSLENRTLTMTSLTIGAAHAQFVQNIYIPSGSLFLPAGHYGSLTSFNTGTSASAVQLLNPININNAFRFRLTSDCPIGPLTLTVGFRDNFGMEFAQTITFEVVMPPIQIVLDSFDNEVSTGQNSTIHIQAKNTGIEDAFVVSVQLFVPFSSHGHHLSINSGHANIGTLIAGGASAGASFGVYIHPSCPAGVEIPLQVEFSNNDGNRWRSYFIVRVLPPGPTNVQAHAVSETSIRITWQQVSGATGYKVYDHLGTLVANPGNVTQYDVTALESGTIYSYRVSATVGDMESVRSPAVSARTWERLVFNRQYGGTANSSVPHSFRFYIENGAVYDFSSSANFTAIYENTGASWFTFYAFEEFSRQTASQSGWVFITFNLNYQYKVRHPEQAASAFTLLGNTGLINEAVKTITVGVPFDTNLTNLTPVITAASSWTVTTSGAQDFSSPVTYTFTKGDITQVYAVTVTPGGQGGIDINPPDINDITINGFPTASFTISRSGAGGFLTTRTINLDTGYSNIEWWIGDVNRTSTATNQGRTFVVQSSSLTLGAHTLTVIVYVNSVPYSNEIDFTVVQ